MKEISKGKVKTLYQSTESAEVLIRFHDKVTAGNGEKVDYPETKGSLNCRISSVIFEHLEKKGIDTHYISLMENDLMKCRKVNIIQIEVVVRNFVAGSLCRQTYLHEGIALHPPLVEFYLKDDSKNDPLLTIDRMERMGYTEILYSLLISKALEINDVLKDIFSNIDLDLIDFKLEFGNDSQNGHLLLADELSPDSMRLWKKGTKESMDKDLFRKDKGDIIKAYGEILTSLLNIDI
jgi:phosphoribosylaminoimidazole-succinocarboxamide synthase